MLRLAILSQINKEDSKVVLEYDEDQLLRRLQARVREGLSEIETALKHRFTKQEVATVLTKGYKGLMSEFKEKTITLK